MSNSKGDRAPPQARDAGAQPKADTTIVQKVIGKGALAIESTLMRLRRLQQDGGPPRAPQAAPAPRSPEPPKSEPQPAGRGKVGHDSRGNAIWNWAAQALESTSRMLKRLEAPELSLDDKPKELTLERDSGGGYDPYNQGKSASKPAQGKPAQGKPGQDKPPRR
jgi:hypothetical protein